jgi:O-methyltransferase
MKLPWKIRELMHGLCLSPTAKAVRRDRLTYLSNLKLRRLEKILHDLNLQHVDGNHIEFGVALGGSAIVIATAALNSKRAFTGFDVFGMIPPPNSAKDDQRSKLRYRTIERGESMGIGGDDYYGYRKDLYGDVIRAFSRHGLEVDSKSVTLVKGLFQNTWPISKHGPIAFAHIDCDWYESVRYCLNVTAERLVTRGAIVLDDYHDYGGCRLATDEFLAEHSEFAMQDGANVILRRKSVLKGGAPL